MNQGPPTSNLDASQASPGVVSRPPSSTTSPSGSLLSQRLGHLQIKPIPPAPQPDAFSMPSEIEELQVQLQEARQSIVEWTRAESGWNGQRRLFKLMTENVSDMIAVVDVKGNRVWNNSVYSQLLGYPADQLAGNPVLSEVHPEDKTAATAALEQSLRTGVVQQAEFRARRKDGGWLDLHARMVPLIDAASNVDAVVFVAQDVTEKKRLGQAIALSTAHSASTGVLEGMARDLDQIITSAVGNLSIAKNLNGSQNTVAVRLNEIERALQRARDVLEQMGSISGNSSQARVRTAIEPLVQEAVNSVFRGTMVRAEFIFPRRLPEPELDVEAFSHALRAVATNALQAMDRGVVRITAEFLGAEQIARASNLALKPGGYIHITLQDQGHGMSERTLAHAFEPYFTTRPGAQGLGLTTALSALQRLGGTLSAESTKGVGTILHLYVPALATNTPSASDSSAESAAPSAKKRILLMDDEQMILDIVSRMLSHLGYEVKTCSDGAQAIAAFTKAKNQHEPFDLVLMDLVIPKGLGGQDALPTILKIDPLAKVIASSGHLDHPVMTEHKKFGFIAALQKPYKLERLQQVIQEVLDVK